jgi:hypothetical protein
MAGASLRFFLLFSLFLSGVFGSAVFSTPLSGFAELFSKFGFSKIFLKF